MEDDLDKFVDRLQDQIFEETREAFGEIGFERWRKPIYRGSLQTPDGHAKLTGSCGDTMEMFLVFENDHVLKSSYITDGCGASSVCGSFAAEMALGRDPDEIAEVTGNSILEAIGRFPKENEHCAFLAAETLQTALNEYMMKQ